MAFASILLAQGLYLATLGKHSFTFSMESAGACAKITVFRLAALQQSSTQSPRPPSPAVGDVGTWYWVRNWLSIWLLLSLTPLYFFSGFPLSLPLARTHPPSRVVLFLHQAASDKWRSEVNQRREAYRQKFLEAEKQKEEAQAAEAAKERERSPSPSKGRKSASTAKGGRKTPSKGKKKWTIQNKHLKYFIKDTKKHIYIWNPWVSLVKFPIIKSVKYLFCLFSPVPVFPIWNTQWNAVMDTVIFVQI